MFEAVQTDPETLPNRLRVAKILGIHGLRGTVKLQVYTVNPHDILTYGTLSSRDGKHQFKVVLKSASKGHWLASLEGVTNRTLAEPLVGIDLFIDRSALPPPDEDEYYETDLVNLRVENTDGQTIGLVRGLHDFGAGMLLDLRLSAEWGGRDLMVPFTRACVPVIDLAGGRVVVDPPDGLMDPPEQRDDAAE